MVQVLQVVVNISPGTTGRSSGKKTPGTIKVEFYFLIFSDEDPRLSCIRKLHK